MANRYANLVGSNKIKDEWQKINTGFDKVQQDVDQLQEDVEYIDERVDTIIGGTSPEKDPELVDIRTPDPSYVPLEPINTAGGMTRDMQRQFVSLRNDYAQFKEEKNLIVDKKFLPGQIDPLSLTFKRKSVKRNFYNLKINLAELDPAFDFTLQNTNMYPRTDYAGSLDISRESNKLKFANNGDTIQESVLQVSNVFPYGTYDIHVDEVIVNTYTGNLICEFSKDSQNRIVLAVLHRFNREIRMEVFKNGVSLGQSIFGTIPDNFAPYILRVQLSGGRMHVFTIKNGITEYKGSHGFGNHFDLRDQSICADFKWRVGARLGQEESISISKAECNLTCGTGQADPRVFSYKDGAPIIKNNKIWVAMTTRGFDQIPDSYQGVYSLNLSTFEWTLEGALMFDRGDGIWRQDHAAQIIYDYDLQKWMVFVPSHSEATRIIYAGAFDKDPRSGITVVPVSQLNMPTGSFEDPYVVYDRKWIMVASILGNPITTVLLEADNWNGPYTIVNQTTKNETGQMIQKVGGDRYIFVGASDDKYRVYSYDTMTEIGYLNVDYPTGAFRVWPVVIPIQDGKETRYLLLTFDRGCPTGAYSYGSLYLYEAKERNSGYEYDYRIYSDTI